MLQVSNGQQSNVAQEDNRMSAFNKVRARLKVRAMANSWRRRATDRALPGLRPFIPRLLCEEMLDMAKWYDRQLLLLEVIAGASMSHARCKHL